MDKKNSFKIKMLAEGEHKIARAKNSGGAAGGGAGAWRRALALSLLFENSSKLFVNRAQNY